MNIEDRRCFNCSNMKYFEHPKADGCAGECFRAGLNFCDHIFIHYGTAATRCGNFMLCHNNELVDTREDDNLIIGATK